MRQLGVMNTCGARGCGAGLQEWAAFCGQHFRQLPADLKRALRDEKDPAEVRRLRARAEQILNPEEDDLR